MAKGFKHGAGGMDNLNFRVVAYGTEEELLASAPKENTIGIVTDQKITSWELSVLEPETGVEGQVWISLGDRSVAKFNGLKKNAVILFPLSAKQYRSGIWEEVDAKSFLRGSWRDWWDGNLYHQGNSCEAITGGWKAYAYKTYGSGSTVYAPTATFNTDSLKVYMAKPSSGYRAGALFIENAIDLSNYTKLKIHVTTLTGLTTGVVNLGLSATKENNFAQTAAKEITDVGVYTLDLTGISGSFYVHVSIGGLASSGSDLTLVLDSVWLE